MNAVDLADQRRAAYTVHQRARRNWLSLFFWLLDISLVNAHLLYELARYEQFSSAIDAGTIMLNQITSHPLGKSCEPVKFHQILAKQLLPAPFSNQILVGGGWARPRARGPAGRIRRTYIKKTGRILLQTCSRPPINKATCWQISPQQFNPPDQRYRI